MKQFHINSGRLFLDFRISLLACKPVGERILVFSNDKKQVFLIFGCFLNGKLRILFLLCIVRFDMFFKFSSYACMAFLKMSETYSSFVDDNYYASRLFVLFFP